MMHPRSIFTLDRNQEHLQERNPPRLSSFPHNTPLLCLISSTFCTSRREQRADIKTTAFNSKPQQRASFCSRAAPSKVHVTALQAGFHKLQRYTSNSWETAALKESGALVTVLLFVQRLGK